MKLYLLGIAVGVLLASLMIWGIVIDSMIIAGTL